MHQTKPYKFKVFQHKKVTQSRWRLLLHRTSSTFNFQLSTWNSIIGFLLVLLCWSGTAWAVILQESDCHRLIRTNQLRLAGQCYLQLFKALCQQKKESPDTPVQKDHFLNRAAMSFYHYAKRHTAVEVKAYHTEKAMKLLMQSFQQGFCEAGDRCRSNRLLAEKLRKEVRYTPFVVVTGHKAARVQVTGYQFKQAQYFQFNRKLRPGKYRVAISYPGQPARTKTVALRPGVGVTINVTPVDIKLVEHRLLIPKKVPPLVISGYTFGGVALALGLGIIVYGAVEENRLNSIISDPLRARALSHDQYQSSFQQAQNVKTAGFVTGGTGLAILVSTVVAHVATNQSKQKNKKLLIANQTSSRKKKFQFRIGGSP